MRSPQNRRRMRSHFSINAPRAAKQLFAVQNDHTPLPTQPAPEPRPSSLYRNHLNNDTLALKSKAMTPEPIMLPLLPSENVRG